MENNLVSIPNLNPRHILEEKYEKQISESLQKQNSEGKKIGACFEITRFPSKSLKDMIGSSLKKSPTGGRSTCCFQKCKLVPQGILLSARNQM
ncbi:hypothetical protein TNIN_192011 [Trichonephila inaurata madagascariensis]|uniref:Uncharacterized protein n=1 Tax=Trichonephila inaurata madagascariensis TaxID=2747483 RepID=A0A8X7CE23_9ARAC|nr:hypothetical protein TNIN_192011 [Trichonephila inaurata madagascariensis]